MASEEICYSIDTSAILEAYVRRYPPDVVPNLWDTLLDELIDADRLFAAYDVLEDLSKRDDDVHQWVKDREDMLIDIDEYQDELKEIMANYPRLVDTKTGKSGSDPMVIALALSKGLTVVSQEARGSSKSPRIPDVCDDLDIPHIDILTFIREQKWTFGS